jgi:hypothetical protein
MVFTVTNRFLAFALLGIFLLLFSSFSSASLSCEFVNSSICPDSVIFKLKSESGENYNNSHVQLWDYADPGYPFALCCSSQNQDLIIDCDDSGAVEVLRLASPTNSHVQFASDFTSLVSQWRFNNNFFDDISGFHAVNNGASWVNDRKNNSFSALSFSGSDFVQTEIEYFTFNNLSNFSVSFWFKVNDVPVDGNVMGIIGRGSVGRWAVDYYFAGNQLRAGTRGGTTYSVSVPFSSDNHSIWHHAVFTYESENEMVLYLNGVRVSSRSTVGITWEVADSLINIGNSNAAIGGTQRNFIGEIDEVLFYDRAISSQEVSLLFDNGLVGHWRFDNNFLDYSGYQNHGANNGASWTNNRYGVENRALSFSGAQSVVLGNSHEADISVNDNFSVSLWVYAGDDVGGYIIAKRSGGYASLSGWYISHEGEYIQTAVGNNLTNRIYDGVVKNKWTHLVLVNKGSFFDVYIDGVLKDIFVSGEDDDVVDIVVGARSVTSYPLNDGFVDDVRIFNRTITEPEISKLFIEGKSKYKYPVCIGGQGSADCLAVFDACPEDYACMGSIASSEGWDFTNAHISGCNYYDLNICCKVSSPPDIPQLIYPEHNDSFFINRSPNFLWSDISGAIEYQVVLSRDAEFNSLVFDETVSSSNYYYAGPLDFDAYYWKVRVFDGELYSGWSDISNFTLITNVVIDLLIGNINFGLLSPLDHRNTSDGSPSPFTFRNSGNVEADLSSVFVSESLWSSSLGVLGTDYWMIRARSFESFNFAESITNWVNVSSNLNNLVKRLNYTGEREVIVDIAINVPVNEPPGNKSSIMEFLWGVAI